MLIRDWMTRQVATITPDSSMMKASRLMKERQVHRLPVLDEKGKVVGIISDRDVKEASPSKATSLDMHELYYLLSEIKVKDIMTKNPVCMRETDTVEQAAIIMIEHHIGGMPVVDEAGGLRGIITDSDVFKVLINITGARSGGLQLAFELSLAEGSLKAVLDALREYNARFISVLTSQQGDDKRSVYIRIRNMDRAAEKSLVDDLQKRFKLIYWSSSTPSGA